MNVFVVGSPFETAQCLDKRRLNKQIIECKQILKAINGESKAWANHPATLQYVNHVEWLKLYMHCLNAYHKNMLDAAKHLSNYADTMKPHFHTEEYLTQMKRRLYTKDNSHYSQWKDLAESDVNMYYVNNEWRYYRNGKQIKVK